VKHFAVILILFSLIGNNFSKLFYYADYQFNREIYLQNCINKAKPALKCNGHCQLQKKLNKEEERNNGAPERKTVFSWEIISSKSFFASVNLLVTPLTITFTSRNINTTIDVSSNLFHPPQQA